MELAPPPASEPFSLRDALTNALAYWEPRRLVYNAVLAVVVLGCLVATWPQSREAMSLNLGLIVFVLAVIANALYCLAYVADVFVQLSSVRTAWLRSRWVLLWLGTAFAAIVARFVALGLFAARAWT